tara:strand:+ start:1142 stop:1516 length:375 start_codon:yes stop_codon:yes gene_type:complete
MEMKKNFSLSVEAHKFASEIREEKGNPQEYMQLAQLGMALGFSDKDHLNIDKASLKHNIADTQDILDDGATVVIYKGLFPEMPEADIWINIEKAASHGICLIKEKYYDKQDKVIIWHKIIKDFF